MSTSVSSRKRPTHTSSLSACSTGTGGIPFREQATKAGVKHVESLKRAHSTRVNAVKAEAEQVAQRLTASPITVAAHAGEEGRLFGSVTPSDVAEALEAQTGVRVDRHDVHMDEPIRSVGVHAVRVHLFSEVDPVISVEVTASEE